MALNRHRERGSSFSSLGSLSNLIWSNQFAFYVPATAVSETGNKVVCGN